MEIAIRQAPIPAPAATAAPEGPILGIDPGLRRTGYAILVRRGSGDTCRVLEAGVVRLNPADPMEQRLLELERSLDDLIGTHRPGVMACEQLYAHYKHPRTAILMGAERASPSSLRRFGCVFMK